MFASLMPELLSINAALPQAIALAARNGYTGVDTQAAHLTAADLDPMRTVDEFAAHGLRPGYISRLPDGFRRVTAIGTRP